MHLTELLEFIPYTFLHLRVCAQLRLNKALYLTPFYILLHLDFIWFLLREIARKTRKFSQLCAIMFFQKKIDNFKSQLRQITTYILVKKNSIFKTFFPYFWSLNKKTVSTLLLAIAQIYTIIKIGNLHLSTPFCTLDKPNGA